MKRLAYIFSVSLFLLLGCGDFLDQTVEIDIPEHESVLTTTCRISNYDTTSVAYVSETKGILDNTMVKIISNAEVSISTISEQIELEYDADGTFNLDGFYLGEKVNLPNTREVVTISIRADGYPDIISTQRVPKSVKILDFKFTEGEFDGTGEVKPNKIEIQFQDPPNEENYYSIRTFFVRDFNGQISRDETLVDIDDPLLSPQGNSNRIFPGFFFDDRAINGEKYTIKFENNFVEFPGEEVNKAFIVQLASLSKDSYLYNETFIAYERSKDNPFAEPTVVHNNLKGGFGIFTVDIVDEALYEY